MKIAYFPDQSAVNSEPVLKAMIAACESHGHGTVKNGLDADAAIIWSVLWHGRMKKNQQVYQHYRSQNKPVICVDIGALYRGHTWKIALNNITAHGYYGHHDNLDWDRPRRLGISLADVVIPQPQIIIAAQHSSSLQVEKLSSMEHWINQQIDAVRQYTDRPIVVRPHPRSALNTKLIHSGVEFERPIKLTETYDSFDMHFNCHAVINYNSGPGIQAAISGCRPVVDSSSLAWPVSINLANIEQPYTVDRDQWLVEICHTEYTVEEIRQGVWLQRLKLD